MSARSAFDQSGLTDRKLIIEEKKKDPKVAQRSFEIIREDVRAEELDNCMKGLNNRSVNMMELIKQNPNQYVTNDYATTRKEDNASHRTDAFNFYTKSNNSEPIDSIASSNSRQEDDDSSGAKGKYREVNDMLAARSNGRQVEEVLSMKEHSEIFATQNTVADKESNKNLQNVEIEIQNPTQSESTLTRRKSLFS
jgi:hypothetical protein